MNIQPEPKNFRIRTTLLLAELRAPFLTATLASVILGTAMAWSVANRFDTILFILTLVGTSCLHAGANVINDYFDYRSGCDQANRDAIPPFTGGSGLLVQGALSPKEVLAYALGLFTLGGSIGFYLAMVRGWFVLVLVIFGILSGYFYTTHLATRGIGELFVGLNFGPLLALGTYYVQTQALSIEPFIAALSLGLLVTAILWINEIPDHNADSHVGKNTAVVRLGKKRAADIYAFIVGTAYLTLVIGVATHILPITSLLALLTLYPAVKAMKIASQHYDSKELRPANALTIQVHFTMGILLTIAYILSRFLHF